MIYPSSPVKNPYKIRVSWVVVPQVSWGARYVFVLEARRVNLEKENV